MNQKWLKSLFITKKRADGKIYDAEGTHLVEFTDKNGKKTVELNITKEDINRFQKNPTARIAV